MVSCYNTKTKEESYIYNINLLSYNLGDNYYEHNCNLHITIKENPLEYDLLIMDFDYEKGENVKIKFDYPTPKFKSKNEIFSFFNRLVNSHDRDFINAILSSIYELD